MYLLYPTEQDAWNRSEEEGIAHGLGPPHSGERLTLRVCPEGDH
jgi:hypothetical protein